MSMNNSGGISDAGLGPVNLEALINVPGSNSLPIETETGKDRLPTAVVFQTCLQMGQAMQTASQHYNLLLECKSQVDADALLSGIVKQLGAAIAKAERLRESNR